MQTQFRNQNLTQSEQSGIKIEQITSIRILTTVMKTTMLLLLPLSNNPSNILKKVKMKRFLLIGKNQRVLFTSEYKRKMNQLGPEFRHVHCKVLRVLTSNVRKYRFISKNKFFFPFARQLSKHKTTLPSKNF